MPSKASTEKERQARTAQPTRIEAGPIARHAARADSHAVVPDDEVRRAAEDERRPTAGSVKPASGKAELAEHVSVGGHAGAGDIHPYPEKSP